MERGIPHLVKFLRKLSEIKGDKNFLKRREVDVIEFRPLIKILLIKILMNGTITGLSLTRVPYCKLSPSWFSTTGLPGHRYLHPGNMVCLQPGPDQFRTCWFTVNFINLNRFLFKFHLGKETKEVISIKEENLSL